MRAIEVPRYGAVWAVGPAPATRKLAEEVDAYFALGVEVPPGGLVVDVGANIGMFALATAARTEGVRFLSIEPIPEIFDALATNFRRNRLLSGCERRLVQAAIVRDARARTQELSYFKRFPSDTTAHLEDKRTELERVFTVEGKRLGEVLERALPSGPGRALGALAEASVASLPRGAVGRWVSDRVMGRTQIRARAATLTELLAHEGPIDLLKVDVEGAELDVLASLDEPTWARVRRVVMESNDRVGPAALGALLRARGLGEQRTLVPPRSAFGAVSDFLLDARRG